MRLLCKCLVWALIALILPFTKSDDCIYIYDHGRYSIAGHNFIIHKQKFWIHLLYIVSALTAMSQLLNSNHCHHSNVDLFMQNGMQYSRRKSFSLCVFSISICGSPFCFLFIAECRKYLFAIRTITDLYPALFASHLHSGLYRCEGIYAFLSRKFIFPEP